MRRFFLQFVAVVTLAHAAGVVAWFLLIRSSVATNAEVHLDGFLDGPSAVLVEELARDSGPASVARAEERFGWPLAVIDAGSRELSAHQQADLAAGDLAIAVAYPEIVAWRAIDEGRWVEIGPFPLVPPGGEFRWFLLALFASAGITTAIGFTVRRIHRDLVRLADTAQALGRGELGARARLDPDGPLDGLPIAFDEMADRVERLVALQRETLQGVSHELRTPLARLRFALELVADAPEAERAAEIERMGADVEQMDRLIDELLTYLRLDAPPEVPATPIPVGPVVAEIADDAAVLRRDLPCAVEVADGLAAHIEPRLLRRALRNLVGNALRHARRRVVVRARAEDGRVRIEVEDDGAGVPAADRERVFLPFTRLEEARSRDPAGSGLGLPIVRRIARAHGGDVHVEDAGPGARFVLRI